MRLFQAELRKLFSSKVIAVMLLILLLANFLLTLYTTKDEGRTKAIAEAYRLYLEDPEGYAAYYGELEERLLNAPSGTFIEIPRTIDPSGKYNDYDLLHQVFGEAERFEAGEWEKSIRRILRTVDIKIEDLRTYGYSDATYTMRSQVALRARYEALLGEVTLVSEYSRGYDTYFSYELVSVFILIFLTLAVSYVFLHDASVGFRPVLYTTRRGGLPTAAAKLGVVCLLTVVTTLLFSASSFLAVGITEGFSSSLSPIQNFEAFYSVPDPLSVLGYLALHTLLRLVAFLLFATVLSLLASTGLPYIVCFGGSFAFAGLNCLLFYRTYRGTVPSVKYLNLASMAEGGEILGFYRTVNLLKTPVRMHAVTLTVSLALVLLLSALAAFCFTKDLKLLSAFGKRLEARWRGMIHAVKRKLRGKTRTVRGGLRPLWCFELQKLRPILVLLLILVILLARYAYVKDTVGLMERYSEALYYSYITEIENLSDTDRAAHLSAERERLDGILRLYSRNTALYERGEMPREEYFDYLDLYYTAENEDAAFQRVEKYVSYLEAKNAETGLDGKIIYSTGYEQFFALGPDLFLYAAAVILSFRVFSVEYMKNTSSGGFSQILRTTKKGRDRVFFTKVLTFGISSVLLAAVFRVTDFLAVKSNYVMQDLGETLYSVESFSVLRGGLPILGYLAVDVLLTALSAFVLSTVILTLSFFLKKNFAVLSVTILVTALPELLTKTVLTKLADFSILSLTAPQDFFCRSVEKQMLGLNAGYLLLVSLLYLLVAAVLAAVAHGRYCGR